MMHSTLHPRVSLAVVTRRYQQLMKLIDDHCERGQDATVSQSAGAIAQILKISKSRAVDYMVALHNVPVRRCLPLLWFMAVHAKAIRDQTEPDSSMSAQPVIQPDVQVIQIVSVRNGPEVKILHVVMLTGEHAGKVLPLRLSDRALLSLAMKLKYRYRSGKMPITQATDLVNNRFLAEMQGEASRYKLDFRTVRVTASLRKWNKKVYEVRHNGRACPITGNKDCNLCEQTSQECCCGLQPGRFPCMVMDERL